MAVRVIPVATVMPVHVTASDCKDLNIWPSTVQKNRAAPAPPNQRTSQLPATNRDKQRGQKVCGGDDLLRETKLVLTG